VGWRSFCHLIYEYKADELRSANIFNHRRHMGPQWWQGGLGIPPVDYCIKKVERLAYCHHIERLMYLGAFMLLCEIDPNEVFDWFITQCAIDAYDWVMVPNIYGMSQFSAGPVMMTRPYFSSSNYILKMSDFKATKWATIWDALYYNFIDNNQEMLSANYSTANSVRLWAKKAPKEKAEIKMIARDFIDAVTKK
jgi:deoxyribodipyrimidine photolyase-related protein